MLKYDLIIRAIRKNRTLLLVLASLVVAITTYMLVLPAFTLDANKAKEQGGIDVGASTKEIEFDGGSYTVKCTLNSKDAASDKVSENKESNKQDAKDANEAGIDLSVKELTKKDKDYSDYVKKAEEVVAKELDKDDSNKKIAESSIYDISLMNDGKETEPEEPVSVTFEYDKIQKMSGADDVRIVHFAVNNGKEKIEVLDPDDVSIDTKKDGIKAVNFKAESFSVYAIVYTVDFAYEVDGETYEWSMEGGKSVELKDLLTILKVFEKNNIDTDLFMSEIDKVEFSDESLVKIDKDGEDYKLVSLKPFTTDETLTITMKNGDVITVKVTDAQDPSAYVGKEVIIYDNGEKRAMISGGYTYDNHYRLNSIPLSEAQGNEAAHWTVERHNNNYYLKSSDNRYLTINGDNVGLVNNWSVATPLGIQAGTNPDYRIYDANNYNNVLTYYTNNNWGDGFFGAPGAANSSPEQRWLYIKEIETIPDRAGDWMLYFDDDFSEITIHVGETVSLRPYNKWEWKEGGVDVQTAHWNIGGRENNYWNQININDDNGAHKESWDDGGTGDTAGFHWTAYVKKDDQLNTHYWAVQGQATKTGDYVLTNTKNGKTITVHVVDGSPVNKPKTINNVANIKVNLFDYDNGGKLDEGLVNGETNKNLANNSNFKNESVNQMGGSNHFYFLSSGSGDNNNESWNSYTRDRSNPEIVKDTLGSDGYPELNHGYSNQSLKYLFDTSKASQTWHGGSGNNGMIAYPDVVGMFQKDNNGYYYYNSNTNYYYYDTATGTSKLYEHTYTQNSSASKGALANDKPIGFFPFHDYNSTEDLYVNQNKNLNHHVGMSMEL